MHQDLPSRSPPARAPAAAPRRLTPLVTLAACEPAADATAQHFSELELDFFRRSEDLYLVPDPDLDLD